MKQTLKELLIECVTLGRNSQGAIDPSFFPSQVRGLMSRIEVGMVSLEDPGLEVRRLKQLASLLFL